MGQTRKDREYEHGVSDGQRGGFMDDFAQGIKPKTDNDPYDKGYSYGADHRYDSKGDRHHSSNDSSGSDSGSCCFITTACLRALNLPEDSLELKAMKILTREHILQSRQGKRDYILYGRISPSIVRVIEGRSDSHEIWGHVYGRLQDVTKSVGNGAYEEGYQSYKSLVAELHGQYQTS